MTPSGPPDDRSHAPESDAAARSRASDAIWTVMDGTAFATGAEFFPALVQQLAQALDVSHAFVAECTDPSKTRVRTLAFWSRDRIVDNVEFDVAGTPCEFVIAGNKGYHPHDLQTTFPEDVGLVDLGARELSRTAARRWDVGEMLGHLAVLDNKPMDTDRSRRASCAHLRPARHGARAATSDQSDRRCSIASCKRLPIARGRCWRSTTPSSST